jgi:mRNA-degrading endonuclease RelE of RelBE toxin-antitoxin system
MTYQVFIKPAAQRQLKKLTSKIQTDLIGLCFKGVVDFFERRAQRVSQKNQQHL